MPRRALTYTGQKSFRGGINQEPENLRPNQVLDARNVWVRNGELAKRPGTRFIYNVDSAALASTSLFGGTQSFLYAGADPGATVSVEELNAIDAQTYVYLGTDTLPSGTPRGFVWEPGGTMTADNQTYAALEYWNGTEWVRIETTFACSSDTRDQYRTVYETDAPGFNGNFVYMHTAYYPTDWAQTSVSGTTAYWLRLYFFGEDQVWASAGGTPTFYYIDESNATVVGLGTAQLSPSKVFQYTYKEGTTLWGSSRATSAQDNAFFPLRSDSAIKTNVSGVAQPATYASIPEFDVLYMAYDHTVYEVLKTSATSPAEVNSDPSIIGDTDGTQESDVIYDTDTIAQLTAFPKASYILYFKGRMWAAGIEGEPFTVRWSGPTLDGAYNVWPSVSFETLSENDNSPITGLAALNEHLVVFKQDSIWLMVFSGTNELGLATFSPVKVVSGIGTVSQASIAEVNGRIIFLAEDGFYEFDGTPNVKKLSGVIDEQVGKINPARKKFAAGVHWRRENVYMCAVSLDSATENNFVFVYDYKNLQQGEDGRPVGAWWFWDTWSVQSWLREEGVNDEETLRFGDQYGRIFEVRPERRADAGRPIDAYHTTHRIGYSDRITKRWRDLRVWGVNGTEDFTVEVLRYDEGQGANAILLTDSTEDKWDTGVWDTATWVADKRRVRKLRLRETSEWIQLKFRHNSTEPYKFHGFEVGFTPMGIR